MRAGEPRGGRARSYTARAGPVVAKCSEDGMLEGAYQLALSVAESAITRTEGTSISSTEGCCWCATCRMQPRRNCPSQRAPARQAHSVSGEQSSSRNLPGISRRLDLTIWKTLKVTDFRLKRAENPRALRPRLNVASEDMPLRRYRDTRAHSEARRYPHAARRGLQSCLPGNQSL